MDTKKATLIGIVLLEIILLPFIYFIVVKSLIVLGIVAFGIIVFMIWIMRQQLNVSDSIMAEFARQIPNENFVYNKPADVYSEGKKHEGFLLFSESAIYFYDKMQTDLVAIRYAKEDIKAYKCDAVSLTLFNNNNTNVQFEILDSQEVDKVMSDMGYNHI